MLRKTLSPTNITSPHYTLFKGKVNNYIKTTIPGNKVLAQFHRRIIINKTKGRQAECHCKGLLTQSMNITPVSLLNATIAQTDRKCFSFKKKLVVTESQMNVANMTKKQIAQMIRQKGELKGVSSTYLGHYNIFDYIARTNEAMLYTKLQVQSFREKNLPKKISYALISQSNKDKLSQSQHQWEYRNKKLYHTIQETLDDNHDHPTHSHSHSNCNSPSKQVKSSKYKASLFLTNVEIASKILEEMEKRRQQSDESEKNTETALKKELVKILSETNNSPQGYFQKMDKELKKDIRKHDYKVKDTLNNLRRLQNINDNKLTKKAFILKDIY